MNISAMRLRRRARCMRYGTVELQMESRPVRQAGEWIGMPQALVALPGPRKSSTRELIRPTSLASSRLTPRPGQHDMDERGVLVIEGHGRRSHKVQGRPPPRWSTCATR